jgi:hypothetical protein
MNCTASVASPSSAELLMLAVHLRLSTCKSSRSIMPLPASQLHLPLPQVRRGVPVLKVRRGVQTAAFLGPVAALLALANPNISPPLALLCMTAALGITSLGEGRMNRAHSFCTDSDSSRLRIQLVYTGGM